jgi:Kinesin motor domain
MSMTQGFLQRESICINQSLSELSKVVENLQKRADRVVYRGSKLTKLLERSLSGENSKTLAIVCCDSSSKSYNKSLNTLRFAKKLNRVALNKKAGPSTKA